VEQVLVQWWEETEEGCAQMEQELPRGQIEQIVALPGSCEIVSVASSPDASSVLVLRGHDEIDLVPGGPLPLDEAANPIQVGWTAGGLPMMLTAEVSGEATDEGAPFLVQTWIWQEQWQPAEETTEVHRTIRAVEGGPAWRGRAPGGTSRLWTLENAPGFALQMPDELVIPRKLQLEGTLFWGTVPLPTGQLAIRYTQLGVPLPAGPVLRQKGKRWTQLDDTRFFEAPASVQIVGDWMLLTYEGWNAVLVHTTRGTPLWTEDERLVRTGVRLLRR
jgi:hypothetical protein